MKIVRRRLPTTIRNLQEWVWLAWCVRVSRLVHEPGEKSFSPGRHEERTYQLLSVVHEANFRRADKNGVD